MKLLIQKTHPAAIFPTYAHDSDAGMDLHTVVDVTLQPGERAQLPTGIAMTIPEGYVGLVWDKSGISHTRGLKTLGGVVDSGYRGELLIGLVNVGDVAQSFSVGDKIAQLLIQKVVHPEIEEVEILPESDRGMSGFGSTGR